MVPASEAYKYITAYMRDANALTANDMRSTFHGYDPESYPDAHIDFCFISNQVTALNSHIIDELVEGKFPSDHYGLYTKINI
jgi:endonuclease/exonuclease/phosphatase family metal-dependent hydrolase